MAQVKSFVFNDIQVNTYVVSDGSGECVIVDPGCYYQEEKEALKSYLEKNALKPVAVLNTHGHFDHIPGNRFVCTEFNVPLRVHKDTLGFLKLAPEFSSVMGWKADSQPHPAGLLQEGDTFSFGTSVLKIIHAPGHCDGSLCFYCESGGFVLTGDVLFQESIGRTDLPTGHYETLIENIQKKLLTLPDETVVYPGHGPATTIGHEKQFNPYL